jgi:outer membrane protein TolC
LRDVGDGKARIDAAVEARKLAQEEYDAELIRLQNDHSTTFQVRESQRDLIQDRNAETRAIVDYQIRLANLSRAQGLLAQEYGVVWIPDPPRPGQLWE